MSFLKSFDISASGIALNRLRMDIVSQNIANAKTTRTDSGGPYKRKLLVVQEADRPFSDYLNESSSQTIGKGVKAKRIVQDNSPLKKVYSPEHPDSIKDSDSPDYGYVLYPNVDTLEEMVDLLAANRAYEANVTAFNATKNMLMKTLEIGR